MIGRGYRVQFIRPCMLLSCRRTLKFRGVSVAWLMEQVILRLGYGIDEGLSPAEATLWLFFPTPPYQQKQKPKKLEEC